MKKVAEVELKELQLLKEELFVIVSKIGELYLTKSLMQKDIEKIDGELAEQESKFSEFQEKERVIYKRFQEKYGPGNINVETGEITA
jgi:uncharacterized coiled-coil protein SlyX